MTSCCGKVTLPVPQFFLSLTGWQTVIYLWETNISHTIIFRLYNVSLNTWLLLTACAVVTIRGQQWSSVMGKDQPGTERGTTGAVIRPSSHGGSIRSYEVRVTGIYTSNVFTPSSLVLWQIIRPKRNIFEQFSVIFQNKNLWNLAVCWVLFFACNEMDTFPSWMLLYAL